MKEHTDLTPAELQKDIQVLCEKQATGTLMGSTNENKFFRSRLEEGVITHFIYGREHGAGSTEKFSRIRSSRYAFSDGLDMPFPETAKINHFECAELFGQLTPKIQQLTDEQDQSKQEKTKGKERVYRGQQSIPRDSQNKPNQEKKTMYRGQQSIAVDDNQNKPDQEKKVVYRGQESISIDD